MLRLTASRAAAGVGLAAVLGAAATASSGSAAPGRLAGPPLLRHARGIAAGRVAVPAAAATVPDGAKLLGSATDTVDVLVGLRLRDEADLDRQVKAVSDPASPAYGHYLSPAQFRARYAPSQASVDQVSDAMTAAGLRVASVPSNHLFVEVKGSAAAAETAFGTSLRQVRVAGRLGHLPAGTPSLPASLARVATSIEGLDTSRVITPAALTYPTASRTGTPCGAYYGEKTAGADVVPGAYGQTSFPYAPCGYTPAQLQAAYGVKDLIAKGIDGTGVKVGIIDAFAYPHAKADADTYSGGHGLPPTDYTDLSPAGLSALPEAPGGLLLDPDGWAGEQQLDVEAVHAMAPKASIVYHGAATPLNAAFTMTQNDVVNNKEAQIVSNSYGGAQDDADANTDAVLKQAAMQGMGFYFSSGDEGDETKDPDGPGDREVDTSANNPMATGVGGTSLAVGSGDAYLFETGWGTSSSTLTAGAWTPAPPGDFTYGGGGGTSQTYGQPDYQKGVVPDSIARYFDGKPIETSQDDGMGTFKAMIPGRAVPDVAMVGDPNTGMLIGQTEDVTAATTGVSLPTDTTQYIESRVGGTSLSSPLFAGVMALADQAAGTPHGFANPALYKLAGSGAFRDIVDPATTQAVVRPNFTNTLDSSGGTDFLLRSLNQTNTIHTIAGYDDVTGLGTPQALAMVAALAPKNAVLHPVATPTPSAAPSTGTGPIASPTPGGGTTTTPGCTRHRIKIRLKHKRRDRLVKVRVHLAGRHARTVRRKHVRNVTITTPATQKVLRIRTTSRHGVKHRYTITVNTCGRV